MKNKTFLRIIIIIIWLIIIFMFSNQNANSSLKLSNNVLYKIVEVFAGKNLSTEEKNTLTKRYTVYIRKSAHFFLYFILAILIFIFIKDIIKINYMLLLIPVCCCFLYATTDEYHQSKVHGRTARISDIIIDTSGSLVSTSILYYITNKKLKHVKRVIK